MAKINTAPVMEPVYTHEGALAALHDSAREQLWRAVGACLLWEPTFYETGDQIAMRIVDLVGKSGVDPLAVQQIAIDARSKLKLRNAPLWVAAALAHRYKGAAPPPK